MRNFAERMSRTAWVASAVVTISCGLYVPPEEEEIPRTLVHDKNMVLVPARDSSFLMGSTTNQQQAAVVQPVHTVRFTYDFYMDTTEVTQGDYDALMRAAYPGYKSLPWDAAGSGNAYPVYLRNWHDALLYCNARSKRDGLDTVYSYSSIIGTPGDTCRLDGLSIQLQKKGYRLPTEAEWEYACRAGVKTDFYWDGTSSIGECAWYQANSNNTTHPVAQKKPNSFGLYDISGNVWEWCHDWYGVYTADPSVDPTGRDTASKRTFRGGSWFDEAWSSSSTTRGMHYPWYAAKNLGFRAVRRVMAAEKPRRITVR